MAAASLGERELAPKIAIGSCLVLLTQRKLSAGNQLRQIGDARDTYTEIKQRKQLFLAVGTRRSEDHWLTLMNNRDLQLRKSSNARAIILVLSHPVNKCSNSPWSFRNYSLVSHGNGRGPCMALMEGQESTGRHLLMYQISLGHALI